MRKSDHDYAAARRLRRSLSLPEGIPAFETTYNQLELLPPSAWRGSKR